MVSKTSHVSLFMPESLRAELERSARESDSQSERTQCRSVESRSGHGARGGGIPCGGSRDGCGDQDGRRASESEHVECTISRIDRAYEPPHRIADVVAPDDPFDALDGVRLPINDEFAVDVRFAVDVVLAETQTSCRRRGGRRAGSASSLLFSRSPWRGGQERSGREEELLLAPSIRRSGMTVVVSGSSGTSIG